MSDSSDFGVTEVGHPARGGLGPEGKDRNDAVPPPLPVDLDADLYRVTAMPAHLDVLDSALKLVVELACHRVNGADGVSISYNATGL